MHNKILKTFSLMCLILLMSCGGCSSCDEDSTATGLGQCTACQIKATESCDDACEGSSDTRCLYDCYCGYCHGLCLCTRPDAGSDAGIEDISRIRCTEMGTCGNHAPCVLCCEALNIQGAECGYECYTALCYPQLDAGFIDTGV